MENEKIASAETGCPKNSFLLTVCGYPSNHLSKNKKVTLIFITVMCVSPINMFLQIKIILHILHDSCVLKVREDHH